VIKPASSLIGDVIAADQQVRPRLSRSQIMSNTPRKAHLARSNGFGGRSVCRYTSRPSRRVKVLTLEEFLAMPAERRCSECETEAQQLQQSKS
jgi:hypothetical protein